MEDFTLWPVRPDVVRLHDSNFRVRVVSFYAPGTGLTPCDRRTNGAPFANFWPLPTPIIVEHNGKQGTFASSEAAYQCLKWWQDDVVRAKFEACTAAGFQGGEDAFQLKRRCEKDAALMQDNFDGLGKFEAMMLVLRIKWRQPGFRELMLSTKGMLLVEHSALQGRDPYWTDDQVGGGQNRLGAALMLVRDELLRDEDASAPSAWPDGVPRPSWAFGRVDTTAQWQAVIDEAAAALVRLESPPPLIATEPPIPAPVAAATTRSSSAVVGAIGLIADPQYAIEEPDSEPMMHSGAIRRYGRVLPLVTRAIEAFNASAVAAVVQLGDLIDGSNAKKVPPTSDAALAATLAEFDRCECAAARMHHLVGNNEQRNWARAVLEESSWIGRPPSESAPPPPQLPPSASSAAAGAQTPRRSLYYSATPPELPGWRLIILNSYAISTLDATEGSASAEAAKAFLCAHGWRPFAHLAPDAPLADFMACFPGWPNPMPADDLDRRLAANSGGVGDAQLAWLDATLRAAAAAAERVIVFGHVPVLPAVANDLDSISWDYDEVLAALRSPHGRACVVLYCAGHDHMGGYARDGADGIHHLTVPSPLEAEPGTGSRFAIASLRADGSVHLRGEGRLRVEPLRPRFGLPPREDLVLSGGFVLDSPLRPIGGVPPTPVDVE